MEPLDNLKNVQNNTAIKNKLGTNNSSVDSLKVSDTTLESSSCDDGKYYLMKYIFKFEVFIYQLSYLLLLL